MYEIFKFKKDDLKNLYDAISENQKLYFADELSKPPKDFFFPQSETLYTAYRNLKKINIQQESVEKENFVLFGVKPCDMRGIEILDKVYLSDPIDTYYAARRECSTVVVFACSEPEETCFCTAFNIEPVESSGDVTIWFVEDEVFWQPVTEKGNSLTSYLYKFNILKNTVASDDEHLNNHKNSINEIMKRLPFSNLSLKNWDGADLMEKFNSPLWEDLHKACIACGTCTFLCPTCQCYDIKDSESNVREGQNQGLQSETGNCVSSCIKRYRCWDSCMYSDFTLMAHGNNRTTQMQRFRQRFMHKLVYFPENHEGVYSCVGCGRCIDKCPSSLNIVKVIKAFETNETNQSF